MPAITLPILAETHASFFFYFHKVLDNIMRAYILEPIIIHFHYYWKVYN